jgi:hypothetical protein
MTAPAPLANSVVTLDDKYLARAAADIGGYGLVKDASVRAYQSRIKVLLETFEAAAQSQSRAA